MTQQAGAPLTAAQADQVAAVLAEATTLAAAGDRAGALRKLAPTLKTPSLARSAIAARDLRESLTTAAGQAVEDAAERVGGDATGVAAAVELIALGKDLAADVAGTRLERLATAAAE